MMLPLGNPMGLNAGVRVNFRLGIDPDGLPFVAYNGVDLVNWTTVPLFYSTTGTCATQPLGSCNNNLTQHDGSFLGPGCAGGVCRTNAKWTLYSLNPIESC